MKTLTEYTLQELEAEVRVRQRMELNVYISQVEKAVAELEKYATSKGLDINLEFGSNQIDMRFEVEIDAWYCS